MDKELKNHFIDKLIDKYASYLAVDDFKSIFEDLKATINADLHSADVDNARGMFTILYETAPECINDINPDMLWKFVRGNNYLEEFKIPEHITSIEKYAFYLCPNLTNIKIPDSVTSIEDGAFSNCTSLTSIVIPSSVTSIGRAAFYGCNNLTSITIPASVTNIEDSVFEDCKNLKDIVFEENSNLKMITPYMFYGCISLTRIKIPNGVTRIGVDAFNECSNLTSVTIPDSVTSMSKYAFNKHEDLTIKTNNKYVIDYCKRNKIKYQEEII